MFRNVPECSGMFHVPDFIDARYFDGNLKTKRVRKTLEHEGRQSIEFHYVNYDNPISII